MVSDKTRREAFITQNLGLVHACAGRFRGRGIEYDDLYGAGCMGLVKACDNFDPERGVCFSTYAVPVILGEIKKLFREGGTVKVSRSLKELGMRVQAAREHTMKLCGTEPTLSQLAEQLGESVENVAMAIQAAQPAMSSTRIGRMRNISWISRWNPRRKHWRIASVWKRCSARSRSRTVS